MRRTKVAVGFLATLTALLVSAFAAGPAQSTVAPITASAAGPAIEEALRRRARRVLEVAAAHGHEVLVLGAWGAGVFGNAPEVVADAFGEALEGSMRGVFREVVFAVLGDTNRAVFERRFASAASSPRELVTARSRARHGG